MANSAFLLYPLLFAAFVLNCHGLQEERKLHIVYMGEPPEGEFSVASTHHAMLANVLGSASSARESLVYSYGRSINGFAAKLTDKEVEKLSDQKQNIRERLSKLIGARYYNSDGSYDEKDFESPRDSIGHGTHTASTAAGREGLSINSFELNGTTYPLIWGGDAANFSAGSNREISRYCLTGSMNSIEVAGKIVFCETLWDGSGILLANGVGTIMADSSATDFAFSYPLPATLISSEDGQQVLEYIRTTENPIATILFGETWEDYMAPYVVSFSSRGPNPITPDVLKDGQSIDAVFNRTVTNVGSPNSTYTLNVYFPSTVTIYVEPSILSFSAVGEKKSYTVTVTGSPITQQSIASGAITWKDGVHSYSMSLRSWRIARSNRVRREFFLQFRGIKFVIAPRSNYHFRLFLKGKVQDLTMAHHSRVREVPYSNESSSEIVMELGMLTTFSYRVILVIKFRGLDKSDEMGILTRKLHIVYMGERPEGEFSVSSTHHSMLANVPGSKLIGACYHNSNGYYDEKDFNSPRDYSIGHGTDTTSTGAGRQVPGASYYGLANGTARDAIADGLDIISIISVSLGSDFPFPYFHDPIAIGFFHAMKCGILTSNYAGNSRPYPYSISNFALWTLTVAANTIDKKIIAKVVLENEQIFDNPIATIMFDETWEDYMTPYVVSFSSWGPNPITLDVLKPDITAPGVDILAAWSPVAGPSIDWDDTRSVDFDIISGTSMSCPHASEADYIDFLCKQGYNSTLSLITGENSSTCSITELGRGWNLNYPSLQLGVEDGQSIDAVINRTVTNVGSPKSTYTVNIYFPSSVTVNVEPSTLSFSAVGEKKSFTVMVKGSPITQQSIAPGVITWKDGVHSVRSPLVIYNIILGTIYSSYSTPEKKPNFKGSTIYHKNGSWDATGLHATYLY
ncbi:hypothetical protein FEM48_Zijuj11G0045600 [Ziziphus jujuba var. spinosa]|uniref:Cucumisin n=1 Tax=Ziziphus jujuba var. spinosa TaxID=714518 RepID=A0A978UGV1_ZIZJJ|nr:hypothetical protein FEM48_Zijuj11G0045600 [Ziziphus jujuba var. spinosa]